MTLLYFIEKILYKNCYILYEMFQINFRVDEKISTFIDLKMKLEGKSRASISKEIFINGLNNQMMPYLANLYKKGKISIKNIANITGIHYTEVISIVADLIDDIEVDPKLIQYSEEISKKLLPQLKQAKEKGISFKGTINT